MIFPLGKKEAALIRSVPLDKTLAYVLFAV